MTMLRSLLLGSLHKIAKKEDGFNHSFWNEIYVNYRNEDGSYSTKYLHEVDFNLDIINDHDLVRIFEYIVRCHESRCDRFPIKG